MENSEQMKFMVRVNCMTFNQSIYIEKAMDGFTMQETAFPFVCTIIDDASTDGEQEVINNYFQKYFDLEDKTIARNEETDDYVMTFARHKTNRNCYFAVILLKYNHYSIKKTKAPYIKEWQDTKYVALCEGDDYWTNPQKLQKQVDFLEKNPKYSLCCHRCLIYNQNDGTWNDHQNKLFEKHPEGFSFGNKENYPIWVTHTLTIVYRSSALNANDLNKYKYRCDVHMNYHLLSHGPGFALPFEGAVYRKSNSGIYSSLNEEQVVKRWCLIRAELLYYNLEDIDLRDFIFNRLLVLLYSGKACKEMRNVIKVCIKSFCRTKGFKSVFICSKKFLGAYVKGGNIWPTHTIK